MLARGGCCKNAAFFVFLWVLTAGLFSKFLPLCNLAFLFLHRGTMNEEEQFVNIDLNDDNICSVCKLGTDQETLSFCHICFELNLEGKDALWFFLTARHELCTTQAEMFEGKAERAEMP